MCISAENGMSWFLTFVGSPNYDALSCFIYTCACKKLKLRSTSSPYDFACILWITKWNAEKTKKKISTAFFGFPPHETCKRFSKTKREFSFT